MLPLRRWDVSILVVLCVPLFVAIAGLLYRSTLLAPINYNEGWNAHFTSFVAGGKPLYYPPDALVTNNYMPLSFFIVAPVAALMGDAIFAGRLVAWIAFVAVAAMIAACVVRVSGDRYAGVFGAALFAGYMVTNYDIYVGMDDPQMLAHAVMMLGLYVYIRWSDAPWSSLAAAVIMACGLFIKHNIIALPVALALWMHFHDRRAGLRFIAGGVLACVAGLIVCRAAFGRDFISSLLAYRPFFPQRGWRHVIEWTYPMEIPLALAGLACFRDVRDRYAVLFGLYVFFALIVGYAAAGGAAVNFNAMFEVVIGFALAGGHLLARLKAREWHGLRSWVICCYAFSALVGAGIVARGDAIAIRPWLAEQRTRVADARDLIGVMDAHPGPALCTEMALCYWAHKPFELDPLNFLWGVEAGTKDADAVVRRIVRGYYATIEIADSETNLPPSVVAAIRKYYRRIAAPRPIYVRS